MSVQVVTKEQIKKELDTVFKRRITQLKDDIARRERTPYRDTEVQKEELAKYNQKLAIAIVAQYQLQDLIKKHVK